MKVKCFLMVFVLALCSCGDIDLKEELGYAGSSEFIYMLAQASVISGMDYRIAIYDIDTMDYAYTEGRGDAEDGDIRIKRWGIGDDWAWLKSPWDSENPRHTVFKLMSEYENRIEGR